MAYLHCARCDLQIKIHAPFLHIENCPRCLVRAATISPMTLSGSCRPRGTPKRSVALAIAMSRSCCRSSTAIRWRTTTRRSA